jgi:hypothetical protein
MYIYIENNGTNKAVVHVILIIIIFYLTTLYTNIALLSCYSVLPCNAQYTSEHEVHLIRKHAPHLFCTECPFIVWITTLARNILLSHANQTAPLQHPASPGGSCVISSTFYTYSTLHTNEAPWTAFSRLHDVLSTSSHAERCSNKAVCTNVQLCVAARCMTRTPLHHVEYPAWRAARCITRRNLGWRARAVACITWSSPCPPHELVEEQLCGLVGGWVGKVHGSRFISPSGNIRSLHATRFPIYIPYIIYTYAYIVLSIL